MKTDASSEILGALPEQNHGTLTYPKRYPVGYASRSLRYYEKCFGKIEKETLSIALGVERFHEYMLLGTLAASLLGNMLASKRVVRGGEGVI